MSNWMIGFFFGIGVAGWTYAKLTRATGNPDPKQSYIGAGAAGLVAFIFIFTLLKYVLGF